MKVLVLSRNAWDDANSIGNTLSNLFAGIDDIEIANIYFRASKPNNNICKNYFHVTETEILKNWFKPYKNGNRFVWDNSKREHTKRTNKRESRFIKFIHKHNIDFAYTLSNYLWYSKKWINNNLDSFIKDFNPDVIFAFVKSSPQYYLTIKHLRDNYNVPLFSWIADDEYTGLVKTDSKKQISCLEYILKESKAIRGCSEEICDYYNSIFDCGAIPLYKSCDLTSKLKNYVNNPVKLIYAGNLLYGRFEIICRIAEALEKCAEKGINASFEICSNTLLDSKELERLQKYKNTNYLGKQNYEFVKNSLSNADIVLHAESFEEKEILKTKYSFSTKIIDCLQSGSVLLAVGPNNISSVKYVKKIPGAYVIDTLEDLELNLEKILCESSSFIERAKMIREFASKYHNNIDNANEISKLMRSIIKE